MVQEESFKYMRITKINNRKKIIEKLKNIEHENSVRILWAVESGSRSWGFDSPDSDYDVRFIYVNKPDWYMTIEEGPDVIEIPVDKTLDISGWDLRKTLRLFKKSNPVLIEWLVSPFVYMRYGKFREQIIEIASECFSPKACSYHYLRMAENNYNRYVLPRDPVNIKKYFYVLRPLLNILWLHQKKSVPPMKFLETLNILKLPKKVVKTTHILLEQKTQTSEMGKGPKILILEEFIQEQLKWAQQYCESAPVGHIEVDKLNQLFRHTIDECWKSQRKI